MTAALKTRQTIQAAYRNGNLSVLHLAWHDSGSPNQFRFGPLECIRRGHVHCQRWESNLVSC